MRIRTLEELRHLYDNTLLADLKALDRKRETTIEKLVIFFFLLSAVAGGLYLLLLTILNTTLAAIFSLSVWVTLGGIACAGHVGQYEAQFKRAIIAKIVKFVDEDLRYFPGGHIAKSTFIKSKIFGPQVVKYKGEDLVRGKVDDTEVEFSEIEASYHYRGFTCRSDSEFRGLFFVGDFNKEFSAQVIVLPDIAERLLGHVGQQLQALTKFRGQLIKFEDTEFEKLFAVYSDDEVQARYVLSMSLIRRIVDFRKRINKEIFLSFIESKVYVAIPCDRNLFEPRLSATLLDFGLIQEYFEDLRLAAGIVEDLNLNTRIWSKE